MTSSALTLEHLDNDAIVVLTIDRPRRGNALDSQTLAALHRVLDSINGNPTVRAVVITGAGAIFCAGADIKAVPEDFTDIDATPYTALQSRATSPVTVTLAAQELMTSAFEKIHRLRQPVIAAVNGAAVGGGFALALACDIRYAAPPRASAPSSSATASPPATWAPATTSPASSAPPAPPNSC